MESFSCVTYRLHLRAVVQEDAADERFSDTFAKLMVSVQPRGAIAEGSSLTSSRWPSGRSLEDQPCMAGELQLQAVLH